jgi:hypothetical protein
MLRGVWISVDIDLCTRRDALEGGCYTKEYGV